MNGTITDIDRRNRSFSIQRPGDSDITGYFDDLRGLRVDPGMEIEFDTAPDDNGGQKAIRIRRAGAPRDDHRTGAPRDDRHDRADRGRDDRGRDDRGAPRHTPFGVTWYFGDPETSGADLALPVTVKVSKTVSNKGGGKGKGENTSTKVHPMVGARLLLQTDGATHPDQPDSDTEGTGFFSVILPSTSTSAVLTLWVVERPGAEAVHFTRRWEKPIAKFVHVKPLPKAGDISGFQLTTTAEDKPEATGIAGTVILACSYELIRHTYDAGGDHTECGRTHTITTDHNGQAIVYVEAAAKAIKTEAMFYVPGNTQFQGPFEIENDELPELQVSEVPTETGRMFNISVIKGNGHAAKLTDANITVKPIGETLISVRKAGTPDWQNTFPLTLNATGGELALYARVDKTGGEEKEGHLELSLSGTTHKKGPFAVPKKKPEIPFISAKLLPSSSRWAVVEIMTTKTEGGDELAPATLTIRTSSGLLLLVRKPGDPNPILSDTAEFTSPGRLTLEIQWKDDCAGGDVHFGIKSTTRESKVHLGRSFRA